MKLQETAEALAHATKQIVYIGARPYGKGWFAACGEREVDAGSPTAALRALLGAVRDDAMKAANLKSTEATEQEKLVERLKEIT